MNVSLKKTLIFLAGTIFSFGVFLLAPSAEAATSTVRGKAYWGDYGYIYFHCIDDVIGERFDEAENLAGGNKYQPPLGQNLFHFYSAPCTDLIHGVEINTEGLLSGSAWNPSVGLINFFGGDAPNYGFQPSCPKCVQDNNCIGCYNFTDQRVYGWAQIAATGEYINLGQPGSPSNVVNIYTKAGTPVYPLASGINLGDFAGTASMHSTIKPNVSFNCRTENYPGADTCATRQYRVYIGGLMIGRLSAPNWSYSSACSSGALRAVLRWEKYAGEQTAFEVVVNDTNTFSTSTADYICWSGKKNQPETFQYIISNTNPDCGGRLQYNTPYYWWVRGYDADGRATDWVQYDTNSLTDTDQNLDGNPMTFQTFRHEFPSPFFSWSPFSVTTGTTTVFTSASFAYDDVNPTLPVSCDPARCPGYLWTTSDGDALISATTSPVTDINFFSDTNTTITLRVTDYAGYMCSTSTVLRINYDLPLWREVKAQ